MKFILKLFKSGILATVMLSISCQEHSDKLVVENEAIAHFEAASLLIEIQQKDLLITDQLITVEGYISEINDLNDRNTILLSSEKNGPISILCDMQHTQEDLMNTLEKNQKITIKGILKGSLKDIILLNCIIYKPLH